MLSHTGQDQSFELSIEGLDGERVFHRYRLTEAIRQNAAAVRLDPTAEYALTSAAAVIRDTAPGLSLTVYSTRYLPHDQPVYGGGGPARAAVGSV